MSTHKRPQQVISPPCDFCYHEKISEIFRVFFTENSSYKFLKQPQNAGLKRKLTLTYSTVTDLARFLG